MKRSDFIKIIKLRSVWRIDKRKGDYFLPSGERISAYVHKLVDSQMEIDSLAITENGDLHQIVSESYWDNFNKRFTDLEIMIPFGENETCPSDVQDRRVQDLVWEIVR